MALRVGKLEIQQAAMTFDHRQAVELAAGMPLRDGAKMAPIGLALDPRRGFKANKGLLLFRGVSNAL